MIQALEGVRNGKVVDAAVVGAGGGWSCRQLARRSLVGAFTKNVECFVDAALVLHALHSSGQRLIRIAHDCVVDGERVAWSPRHTVAKGSCALCRQVVWHPVELLLGGVALPRQPRFVDESLPEESGGNRLLFTAEKTGKPPTGQAG